MCTYESGLIGSSTMIAPCPVPIPTAASAKTAASLHAHLVKAVCQCAQVVHVEALHGRKP